MIRSFFVLQGLGAAAPPRGSRIAVNGIAAALQHIVRGPTQRFRRALRDSFRQTESFGIVVSGTTLLNGIFRYTMSCLSNIAGGIAHNHSRGKRLQNTEVVICQ